jgi:hypothetical protein
VPGFVVEDIGGRQGDSEHIGNLHRYEQNKVAADGYLAGIEDT